MLQCYASATYCRTVRCLICVLTNTDMFDNVCAVYQVREHETLMRRRAAQADQIAYSETQMSKKLHPAPVPTDRALQLTNSMAVPQQRLMATDEQV
jgi:hypothetical protein